MVSFPNGSRVWVVDADGTSFEEWQEETEIDEENKTHTISVYIASKKNEEFSLRWCIAKPLTADMRMVDVRVDGVITEGYQIEPDEFETELESEGVQLDATTIQGYKFGELETSEGCDPGSHTEQKEALSNASIEFELVDAVCTSPVGALNFGNVKELGSVVHPDCKVASIVGVQIQGGETQTLSEPTDWITHHAEPTADAITYIACWRYRPASFLIACEFMPDPNPAGSNEAEGEASASSAKKRKRKDAPAPAAGSSAAGEESAEDRKKRLRAELIAIKQELGEDIDGPLPEPSRGSNDAEPEVKPELVLDPSRPMNETIFVDMSADTDSDSDA